jgi:hypothetical protein
MSEFFREPRPITHETLELAQYREAYLGLLEFCTDPETLDAVEPTDMWVVANQMNVIIGANATVETARVGFLHIDHRVLRSPDYRLGRELVALPIADGNNGISLTVADTHGGEWHPIRTLDLYMDIKNDAMKNCASEVTNTSPWTETTYYPFGHESYRSGPEAGERRRFLELAKQFGIELLATVGFPTDLSEPATTISVPDTVPSDWLK